MADYDTLKIEQNKSNKASKQHFYLFYIENKGYI